MAVRDVPFETASRSQLIEMCRDCRAALEQAERELADSREECARLRERAEAAEKERDLWKETAEEGSWPFEWEIATALKDERDKARRLLAEAYRAIENAAGQTTDLMCRDALLAALPPDYQLAPGPGDDEPITAARARQAEREAEKP